MYRKLFLILSILITVQLIYAQNDENAHLKIDKKDIRFYGFKGKKGIEDTLSKDYYIINPIVKYYNLINYYDFELGVLSLISRKHTIDYKLGIYQVRLKNHTITVLHRQIDGQFPMLIYLDLIKIKTPKTLQKPYIIRHLFNSACFDELCVFVYNYKGKEYVILEFNTCAYLRAPFMYVIDTKNGNAFSFSSSEGYYCSDGRYSFLLADKKSGKLKLVEYYDGHDEDEYGKHHYTAITIYSFPW